MYKATYPIPLLHSNCENGSLFRTLQKWPTFFKPKETTCPIPLRALNDVKSHVKRHVCPLQNEPCLYEDFAKSVLFLKAL
jgi:hypothetical protein